MSEGILLRPQVKKSLLKGTLAVAVFSAFLQIGTAKILDYLIFLAIFYALLAVYMFSKHSTVYLIDDSGIRTKSILRAPRYLHFDSISDVSVAQGYFAKRFDCGTVFIELRGKGGSVVMFGGGSAEALRDVSEPAKVMEEIVARVSPFSAQNSFLGSLTSA